MPPPWSAERGQVNKEPGVVPKYWWMWYKNTHENYSKASCTIIVRSCGTSTHLQHSLSIGCFNLNSFLAKNISPGALLLNLTLPAGRNSVTYTQSPISQSPTYSFSSAYPVLLWLVPWEADNCLQVWLLLLFFLCWFHLTFYSFYSFASGQKHWLTFFPIQRTSMS